MYIDTNRLYSVSKSRKLNGNCIHCGDSLDGDSLRIHYEKRGRYDLWPSDDYLHRGCRDAMEACEVELRNMDDNR